MRSSFVVIPPAFHVSVSTAGSTDVISGSTENAIRLLGQIDRVTRSARSFISAVKPSSSQAAARRARPRRARARGDARRHGAN